MERTSARSFGLGRVFRLRRGDLRRPRRAIEDLDRARVFERAERGRVEPPCNPRQRSLRYESTASLRREALEVRVQASLRQGVAQDNRYYSTRDERPRDTGKDLLFP